MLQLACILILLLILYLIYCIVITPRKVNTVIIPKVSHGKRLVKFSVVPENACNMTKMNLSYKGRTKQPLKFKFLNMSTPLDETNGNVVVKNNHHFGVYQYTFKDKTLRIHNDKGILKGRGEVSFSLTLCFRHFKGVMEDLSPTVIKEHQMSPEDYQSSDEILTPENFYS